VHTTALHTTGTAPPVISVYPDYVPPSGGAPAPAPGGSGDVPSAPTPGGSGDVPSAPTPGGSGVSPETPYPPTGSGDLPPPTGGAPAPTPEGRPGKQLTLRC
jgi:hypothetical protein